MHANAYWATVFSLEKWILTIWHTSKDITVQYTSLPGVHLGISQYSHLFFLSVVKHQGRCPEF